jgi:hypothetical protein
METGTPYSKTSGITQRLIIPSNPRFAGKLLSLNKNATIGTATSDVKKKARSFLN